MSSNIILIGARGVGKSKSGRTLAKKLSKTYISTDIACVYEMGGISIARQIERWKGDWSKFRDVEFKVLEKLQSAEDCMIDCGGGILFDWNENKEEILSERKWNLLKKMGKIIYLSRPLPFLVSKVKNDSERPSLSDEKAYAEVLSRRLPFYETHCDVKIDLGYLNKVDSIKKISAYL